MNDKEFERYLRMRFKLRGEDIIGPTGRIVRGSLKGGGYARVDCSQPGGPDRSIALHRLKFFLKHGYLPPVVDHRNGRVDDQSLVNLRASTISQNNANARKQRGCKVLFKGVTIATKGRKGIPMYEARIAGVYIGRFDCPARAAREYDAEARKLFGAHAAVNFPLHSGERSAI